MDDAVIASWADSLPYLARLELLGPFLVRAEAWQSFFSSHPHLTGFLITQSPRFDLECMQTLQKKCQGLTELRLNQVGKLDDEFADVLREMKGLKYLDLGHPTTSMRDEALVGVMQALGEELTYLDVSGHTKLTDVFLDEGIKMHAQALTGLVMSNVPELTDEGVAEFFNTWADSASDDTPALTILDLSRNTNLSSDALMALLTHSGKTLLRLSINGWKTTSEKSLGLIAAKAKKLKWLDVGWCREMDDFIMKAIMEECRDIKEVKVWGCNRLTDNCPRKVCLIVYSLPRCVQCH